MASRGVCVYRSQLSPDTGLKPVSCLRSYTGPKKTLHLKFFWSCSVSIFAAWFDGHFSPQTAAHSRRSLFPPTPDEPPLQPTGTTRFRYFFAAFSGINRPPSASELPVFSSPATTGWPTPALGNGFLTCHKALEPVVRLPLLNSSSTCQRQRYRLITRSAGHASRGRLVIQIQNRFSSANQRRISRYRTCPISPPYPVPRRFSR